MSESDDMHLQLVMCRQGIRQAVLRAILEDNSDFDSIYLSWKEVDAAAIKLAAARRRYDRHVRTVTRNAAQ